MQSLKKNWLLVLKKTWGICWILMRAKAIWKVALWLATFVKNVLFLRQKKYRGVMCHNTEELRKIWWETNLCFEKWYEELGKFWLSLRKYQHLYFNGLLFSKVYNAGVKRLQRSYVSWHWTVIFKEKLTGSLKNDIRNLINFDASIRKSEHFLFDGLVFYKTYKIRCKSTEELCRLIVTQRMTLNSDPKKS